MKKKPQKSAKIVNRRARFDYELSDDLVAGIQLTGQETKSLRQGRGQLNGAFVTVKDGELWLVGALISSGKTFVIEQSEQTRSRKLLISKRELDALLAAKQQGKAIVPLEFLTNSRYIKLRLAIGRGKKRYDKRQTIKQRDQSREAARNLKH